MMGDMTVTCHSIREWIGQIPMDEQTTIYTYEFSGKNGNVSMNAPEGMFTVGTEYDLTIKY